MGMQIQHYFVSPKLNAVLSPSLLTNVSSSLVPSLNKKHKQHQISSINGVVLRLKYDPLFGKYKKSQQSYKVVASAAASSSSGNTNVSTAAPLWDTWSPDKATPIPSLSDVLWPSLGAFVGMAMLGKMDQMLAPKGLSMTIAPLGAVCAVLFVTPKAPAARKYNMFMAQIGCAAFGVLAFTILGPGWLARGAALSASLAFMIYTRSTHPPAASLPLLFIDGAKLHGLNYWYALFPGAAGCILLSLVQEIVYYLKENVKF